MTSLSEHFREMCKQAQNRTDEVDRPHFLQCDHLTEMYKNVSQIMEDDSSLQSSSTPDIQGE